MREEDSALIKHVLFFFNKPQYHFCRWFESITRSKNIAGMVLAPLNENDCSEMSSCQVWEWRLLMNVKIYICTYHCLLVRGPVWMYNKNQHEEHALYSCIPKVQRSTSSFTWRTIITMGTGTIGTTELLCFWIELNKPMGTTFEAYVCLELCPTCCTLRYKERWSILWTAHESLWKMISNWMPAVPIP